MPCPRTAPCAGGCAARSQCSTCGRRRGRSTPPCSGRSGGSPRRGAASAPPPPAARASPPASHHHYHSRPLAGQQLHAELPREPLPLPPQPPRQLPQEGPPRQGQFALDFLLGELGEEAGVEFGLEGVRAGRLPEGAQHQGDVELLFHLARIGPLLQNDKVSLSTPTSQGGILPALSNQSQPAAYQGRGSIVLAMASAYQYTINGREIIADVFQLQAVLSGAVPERGAAGDGGAVRGGGDVAVGAQGVGVGVRAGGAAGGGEGAGRDRSHPPRAAEPRAALPVGVGAAGGTGGGGAGGAGAVPAAGVAAGQAHQRPRVDPGHPLICIQAGLSLPLPLLVYILAIVLVMSNNPQKRESDSPRNPMTETEQIENFLNLQDISEIQPDHLSEETERRINKLEADLREALSDLEMKEKHLENARKTQKTLENFQEMYKKKVSSLEEKLKSMESRDRDREGSSIIESRQDDGRLEELQGKVQSLNETIDKLRKDSSITTRELDRLKQKQFEQSRELEELRASKEDLAGRLKKAEASLAAESKNSKSHQAKVKELEEKVRAGQSRQETTRVQIVKEVVVDNSAVDRLKEQNTKLSNELNKARAESAAFKRDLLELEKKQKKMEGELADAAKGRESLRGKVKDLEETVRQLKRQAQRPKRSEEQESTEVMVKERNILTEEDEEQQQQIEIINPIEKQTRKVLKSVFQLKENYTVEEKVKYLNSIIASAENELDSLSF